MSHSTGSDTSGASDEAVSQNGEQTAKRGVELTSKVLVVDKKRFYLDVKENERGRFLQIVAVC